MTLKQSKVFRAVFSVTGVILVSKLMGFVKQMVTAGTFGATIETDLISLSEGFIGNIKYMLIQMLQTSFVATYLHNQEKDFAAAKKFAVDVGKVFTIIAGSITVLIMLFAGPIARIIAPTYSLELSLQLSRYLRLFSPALICFVWAAIFHALLSANRRFIPGELEGLTQSVILIAMILLFRDTLGIQTLAVAFLLYVIWNAVFLATVSKPYWIPSEGNPFKNPAVKQLLTMASPLLLGYSMVYINEQVGKILVSGLKAGTVTAMGYAAVLSNLIGTIIVSICSILFTYVAAYVSKGEGERAADLALRSVQLLTLVFLPISILTILCAEDVVCIVYGRGAFTPENVRETARALKGYAIMFVPLVLRDIYSRFQYSYQNTKTPMINSTIGIIVNIALSVALCPRYGLLGVTIASSISTAICGVLNAITARKCSASLAFAPFLKQIPLMTVGAVGCVIAARWSMQTLGLQSALMRFIAATACGGAAYLLLVSPILIRIIRQQNPV